MTISTPPSLARFHQCVACYLAAQTGRPEDTFEVDASLIAGRLVDSLTFIQLLDFLEEQGGRVPGGDLELSDLDTIRALYRQLYPAA